MSKIRRLEETDCCANCDYLRWGSHEGVDKCVQNGVVIQWIDKRHCICDDHVRTKFTDPRSRDEKICPACKGVTLDRNKNYCSKCGNKYISVSIYQWNN